MIRSQKSQRRRTGARMGATVVEVAMTLPIVFLVFWGFWEWSRAEMIRQAAVTAAYEGSRRGILPGATVQDMETIANDKLAPFSITGADITSSIANNRASVEVSIPLDQNLWGSSRFFTGRNVVSSFALRLEE